MCDDHRKLTPERLRLLEKAVERACFDFAVWACALAEMMEENRDPNELSWEALRQFQIVYDDLEPALTFAKIAVQHE